MCGDHCSRTPTIDSGDLIAIIHPSSQQRSIFPGGRLHLSNHLPGSTVSTLNCSLHHNNGSGSSSSGSISSSSPYSPLSSSSSSSLSTASVPGLLLSVRIHQFGQPLLSFNAESANPVLHSFAISPCVGDDESCLVGTRLNLGVGGDGVVGRTVSLVDERKQVVLGEGVIGWI